MRGARVAGESRGAMLTYETSVHVPGVSAHDVFAFLADPDDEAYQAWWPGVHLAFHRLNHRVGDHVGEVVYMDEYVGARRLRMHAVVTEALPPHRLAWRMRKGVPLPAHLALELADRDGGVTITHTTQAGFRGPGRLLDPLLRLYFTRRFAGDLDSHVRTEFPRLGELLRARAPAAHA